MKWSDELLQQGAVQAARILDRSYAETEETVEFSAAFERDMQRLLSSQKRPRRKTLWRWIAIAACLLLVVQAGFTETGQAALTALLQRITIVQGDSRTLTYQTTGETTRTVPPMEPTTLPEGMVLAEQYDSEHLRIREYTGEKGEYLRYEQEYAGGTRFRYEAEEVEYLTIGEDDRAIYLSDDEFDTRMLVWLDGTSRLILTGNLEKETMVEIANSVN
ncbi:MAG: DUF4367 domain-containing protein [Eubacteriales bacterium]|nr:DUF4367 domain-containing protein [Eubacteriales bacterium]